MATSPWMSLAGAESGIAVGGRCGRGGHTLEEAGTSTVGAGLGIEVGSRLVARLTGDVLAGVVLDFLGTVLGAANIVMEDTAFIVTTDAEAFCRGDEVGEALPVRPDVALRRDAFEKTCTFPIRSRLARQQRPLGPD